MYLIAAAINCRRPRIIELAQDIGLAVAEIDFAALGAKLAAPDKTVVNVMGDAAFGMSGLDIETAARSEIPILTVVLNNGVMTHYGASMPAATERWGSNRLGGEYAKVAEALGAYGERVESPDQVGPAIQRALETHKSGQPALLEMMTKEEETISRYWER